MPRSYSIQNSFNTGEVSPRLVGRTDLAAHKSGALLIKNLIVQSQGGVKHRPGTRYVSEVKDSDNKTRLVPFVFSTVQAYVLEFSNNLIRVYKDEGIIETAPSTPLEIVTTYTTAQIPSLQFTQSADILYIAHESHPLAKLTRTSDTAWTLADVALEDGPYLPTNANTSTTLTPTTGAAGAGETLTANQVTDINGGDGFRTSDIGRSIWVKVSTNDRGWGVITARASTTSITVNMTVGTTGTTATSNWRLGAFGSHADFGYPTVLNFHEQRLWLGANPGAPQTAYGSMVALFETFSPVDPDGTLLDDNAIAYTIAADQVNVIRWMNPVRALLMGTSGGIWPAQAAITLEAITPTNIQIKRSSVNGGAAVQPTNVDDLAVYVSTTKRKMWSVGYDGVRDAFVSEDLTLLADHISESGIDALAYAAEPYSVVWCVRTDGVLVGITYIRDQNIFGWHRHILGGSFSTGDAVVESVAVIPAPTGDPSSVGRTNVPHDQVWMIVKRTINGATARYVEFMEDDFSDTDVLEDAFYVDSGLTYDGAATDTLTGLDHLEGESVQILADGSTHPDRTVASGGITLNGDYSKVQIGLLATAQLETLNIDRSTAAQADAQGSAQGRNKRIPKITLRLDRSLGGEVCSNEAGTAFDPIFYRASGPMDAPPPLYTGDKDMVLECGWSRTARVVIRQSQPLPFNLVALVPVLELSER